MEKLSLSQIKHWADPENLEWLLEMPSQRAVNVKDMAQVCLYLRERIGEREKALEEVIDTLEKMASQCSWSRATATRFAMRLIKKALDKTTL